MERNGAKVRPSARALDVSHVTLLAWLSGERRPEESSRLAIERWTSGEVPRVAWESAAERRDRLAAEAVQPFVSPAAREPSGEAA